MVVRRCGFKTFTPSSPRSCRGGVYVLPPSAYPKATLSVSVEEFGVVTTGGVWVAAGTFRRQGGGR
jgi:hypothetical protein